LLCWQGAADRPVAAIFHFSVVPNGVSVSSVALVGRRLTQAVGPQLKHLCCCELKHAFLEPLFININKILYVDKYYSM
jgi:hypothetical protein